MNNDLISIVVPIFNVEKYLNRCIKSLTAQTYLNIEIILVDDGSTDSSSYLAEQWKLRDKRIAVIHKKNGGLSDARNQGIKISNGKYICFVDSDDFVDCRFVEILYNTAIISNTKIAAIGFQYTFTEKEQMNNVKIDLTTEIFKTEDAISYLYTNDKYANFAWNKLYLKELFDDIIYPVGRKMEDLGTTYLLFDKCEQISYNPTPLYYYFQRSDSILHTPSIEFWIDKFTLVTQRYNYVKEKYPYIENNYINYFHEVVNEYPYISDEDRSSALKEVNRIWSRIKKKCSLKSKIRFILINKSPNFYIKVFKR